ncbi:MAG TPA: DUF3376 domain-containing protein, partial [Egibacteraceae bacterium]|nr:DUF3376 domain-containing protein [Egibacteraceae bacterium]
TPNAFGAPTEIGLKLTGTRTGHFAAFYKPSWRVNDWIWGRLDAAVRLAQLALDPARLRQLRYSSADALAALREAAVGPPADAGAPVRERVERDRDHLAVAFDAAAQDCARELSYLDDDDLPVPPSLPVCALQVARRVQAEVLREELERLAVAAREDERAGAARDSESVAFRARYEEALRGVGGREGLAAEQLFALFRESRVGAETVMDDAGSDLFAGTVSRAALVGASAVEGRRSGLWPLRAVTRPIRAVLLVLHVLVAGATRGSGFGLLLVSLALAAGGALLAVSALAEEAPPLVGTVGATLAAAAVLLSALRARVWPFVVLLAGGLVTLLFLLSRQQHAAAGPESTFWTVAVVVGLTWAIGMLRQPSAAPPLVRGPVWWQLALVVVGTAATVAVGLRFPVIEPCALRDLPHCGVIGLEFAGTPEGLRELVRDWDASRLADAVAHTRLDFAFLALYWIPISALCALAARALGRRGRSARALGAARAAWYASWAPLVAAGLDVVENVALLRMLHEAGGPLPPIVPAVAFVAAGVKWLLVVGALLYGLVALVLAATWWWRCRRRRG